MTRGLDTRLTKLEAKREMDADDLTHLAAEELDAEIAVLRALIVADRGGTRDVVHQALWADPATPPTLARIECRTARTGPDRSNLTDEQLDARIQQLEAALAQD
jgi:hypothetical protein